MKNFNKKKNKELKEKMIQLLREQFNLRIKSSKNQLKQTHLLKKIRRDIARIKTSLNVI